MNHPSTSKYLRNTLIINCTIFLFSLALYGCGGQGESSLSSESTPKSSSTKINPTEVRVSISEKKAFESFIQAQGKLEARRESALQFRNGNVIDRIHFENGDYVRKGQLIAQQETDLLYNALARAEQEVLVKRNQYIALCCEFNYCLADTVKMPEKKRKQLMAQSGLTLALVNLNRAAINLKRAQLVAPFSGKIANLKQKQGESPNLSEPFCKIYNPSSLEVAAEVIESDYGKLKLGLTADVQVLSEPNKTHQAKLVRINPQVNENGLVQLHFRLPKGKNLLPGMNANVRIRLPSQQQVVIPKAAVVMRSGKAVVFTEKDGLAQWNYVTLGKENGEEVEVIEGLAADEAVIVSNNFQLAHDSQVKVVP